MVHTMIVIFRTILIVVACYLSGCASYVDRLTDVRNTFAAGDLDATNKVIEKGLKKRKEADVLKLERSIVASMSGRLGRTTARSNSGI